MGWGGVGVGWAGRGGRRGGGLSAGMRTSFSTLTVSPRPRSGSFEVIRVALNGTEVHVQECRLLELGPYNVFLLLRLAPQMKF